MKLFLFLLLFSMPGFAQLSEGNRLPEFSLKTLDGEIVDNQSVNNKIVVLNLFSSSCDACREELPVLNDSLWNKYQNDSMVVVLAVGRDNKKADIDSLKIEMNLTLPMAEDPQREFFSKFAKSMIPRNILIGMDGTIKMHYVGFNKKILSQMIEIIEEEKSILKR